MTKKYTSTPWSVFDNPTSNYGLEVIANTTVKAKRVVCRIGGPVQVANAAFIVRAVNNHDALVEALQELAEEAFKNMSGGKGHLIDNAYAALKAAKES